MDRIVIICIGHECRLVCTSRGQAEVKSPAVQAAALIHTPGRAHGFSKEINKNRNVKAPQGSDDGTGPV